MIKLKGIRSTFSSFVLGPVDLEIPRGSFFILMGPTGSGKTLILESVAGLARLEHGSIEIFGRDVTNVNPGKRDVGIVYQDSALFPHLTVLQNISYGEKWGGKGGLSVSDVVEMLDLVSLLDRFPGTLSGGEKQRTALARALATNPSVVLLDEPLSSLDPQFRGRLRQELKDIHRRTGTTFIMATHDFSDALSLGTAGAVVNCGEIEQQGTIDEIFFKPVTPFMASFVGMKNVFSVSFQKEKAVTSDGLEISVVAGYESETGHIAISPESIVVSTDCRRGHTSERNHFQGKVIDIVREGYSFLIDVRCQSTVFSAVISPASLRELGLGSGMSVWLSWKASSIHVY
ncbi:MAG: ABC transporter ATP-binding protein [Candidatus Sabulitectum sp.]|nr:ABC transporter ATP-binding protein [Candidatus Sabulitectum sp.]